MSDGMHKISLKRSVGRLDVERQVRGIARRCDGVSVHDDRHDERCGQVSALQGCGAPRPCNWRRSVSATHHFHVVEIKAKWEKRCRNLSPVTHSDESIVCECNVVETNKNPSIDQYTLPLRAVGRNQRPCAVQS